MKWLLIGVIISSHVFTLSLGKENNLDLFHRIVFRGRPHEGLVPVPRKHPSVFDRIFFRGRPHDGLVPIPTEDVDLFDKVFFRGRSRDGLVPKPPKEARERALQSPYVSTCTISQKLDHFGTSQQMWTQRYEENSEYYKPGGPIFVLIGGEASMEIGWMNSGDWLTNAKIYGAYMFQLEHRYFGDSHPTSDASTPNLQWLSSSQALADLATFITTIKSKYDQLHNAPVIVFGGSYPGNLAAWFRLKYPKLAIGAVASSAPVLAQEDFNEYLEVVGQALDYVSRGCTSNVQQAFNMLTLQINSGNTAQLATMFNLCSDIPSQALDLTAFYGSVISPFKGAVQYNKMGVLAICKVMADNSEGNPLQRLAYLFKLTYSRNRCIAFPKYQDYVQQFGQSTWSAREITSRLWAYLTCAEFGYFQTTDSQNQPFGPTMGLEFDQKLCIDLFGISKQTVDTNVRTTNNMYGGKNLSATNVVLPNGSLDPWHALGILQSLGQTTKAEYIVGGSHCYDMYGSDQYDNQAVKDARIAIRAQIGKFLASQPQQPIDHDMGLPEAEMSSSCIPYNSGTNNNRPRAMSTGIFVSLLVFAQYSN